MLLPSPIFTCTLGSSLIVWIFECSVQIYYFNKLIILKQYMCWQWYLHGIKQTNKIIFFKNAKKPIWPFCPFSVLIWFLKDFLSDLSLLSRNINKGWRLFTLATPETALFLQKVTSSCVLYIWIMATKNMLRFYVLRYLVNKSSAWTKNQNRTIGDIGPKR